MTIGERLGTTIHDTGVRREGRKCRLRGYTCEFFTFKPFWQSKTIKFLVSRYTVSQYAVTKFKGHYQTKYYRCQACATGKQL